MMPVTDYLISRTPLEVYSQLDYITIITNRIYFNCRKSRLPNSAGKLERYPQTKSQELFFEAAIKPIKTAKQKNRIKRFLVYSRAPIPSTSQSSINT